MAGYKNNKPSLMVILLLQFFFWITSLNYQTVKFRIGDVWPAQESAELDTGYVER